MVLVLVLIFVRLFSGVHKINLGWVKRSEEQSDELAM